MRYANGKFWSAIFFKLKWNKVCQTSKTSSQRNNSTVILKWSYRLLKFKKKSFLWNLLFHALVNYLKMPQNAPFWMYSWLSLSRIRLTRISGWVEFLSKSRTSLCINIYNLTPVESNSDESKFRLSRIKVLVPRCRKPYYLHSLNQIYLSKHVYYLRIKIGSQVKHLVIEFDIFTLGYFTICQIN
jgi:hypothetical protein